MLVSELKLKDIGSKFEVVVAVGVRSRLGYKKMRYMEGNELNGKRFETAVINQNDKFDRVIRTSELFGNAIAWIVPFGTPEIVIQREVNK